MTVAIRSVFTAGVAFASAGVIAVSPITPPATLSAPNLSAPAIELTATAVPALGAIPFQILVNLVGDGLALAPILFGSVEQCTGCLGPVGAPSIPFSGWGAVGLATGLVTSPFALLEALTTTGSIGQALGVAGLAIQTPITNTLELLGANRIPDGGFELQGVLDRAFIATKHAVDYAVNLAALALVTVPVALITGAVVGLQTFTGTLAATGDFVAAFNAGVVPLQTAVTDSLAAIAAEVQEGRTTIYTDLSAGPGRATSPIPTLAAAPGAAARAPIAGARAAVNSPRPAATSASGAAATAPAAQMTPARSERIGKSVKDTRKARSAAARAAD
jgi:hypothetical protein